MSPIRFTLLSDGSSDRVLIPILQWLLKRHEFTDARPAWANLGRLRRPPQRLSERIQLAAEMFPCEILFIHRDAENAPREQRKTEIRAAFAELSGFPIPAACVIPVRMQEAWLLIEEAAVRQAAGNPNGRSTLSLPPIRRLESLPDPKEILYASLRAASGLRGQRLKKFSVVTGAHRVAESIRDFSPLLQLSAFKELDKDLGQVVPLLASRESAPYINGS